MELGWKGGEVQINGFGSVMVSPRDLREPPPDQKAAGVRLPTAGKSVAIDDEHSGDGATASPRRPRRPANGPKDAAPSLKPVAPAHLNLELGTMTEYQPTLTPRGHGQLVGAQRRVVSRALAEGGELLGAEEAQEEQVQDLIGRERDPGGPHDAASDLVRQLGSPAPSENGRHATPSPGEARGIGSAAPAESALS